MALHTEKYVQGPSRAKPATTPVQHQAGNVYKGVTREELLHGHWVKLLIRRAGGGQSWQPPWKYWTKGRIEQCLRASAPPWELREL